MEDKRKDILISNLISLLISFVDCEQTAEILLRNEIGMNEEEINTYLFFEDSWI